MNDPVKAIAAPSSYETRRRGPDHIAARGDRGWQLDFPGGDIFIECARCHTGQWSSVAHKMRVWTVCRCEAVRFDFDAGRFGSNYGDAGITIYEVKGEPS